jgi:hypothetical protein
MSDDTHTLDDLTLTEADANGHPEPPDPDVLIRQLESYVRAKEMELHLLAERSDAIRTEMKRYAAALRALTGEPKSPGPKSARVGSGVKFASTRLESGEIVRTRSGGTRNTSKIGPEMYDAIKGKTLEIASHMEEFRQIDVRSAMGGSAGKSSTMSLAFERMRQENIIRFARQDGIQKYFRLTREQVGGGDE